MLSSRPSNPKETRRLILVALKRSGPTTIDAIAKRLRTTHEAIRQHVVQLLKQGWIEPCQPRREPRKGAGRPPVRYCLTVTGDHLFPKRYDDLALEFLEKIERDFGYDEMLRVFAAMADDRVAEWKKDVAGKPLSEKVEIVRRKFAELERETVVERSENGYRIIERNCPFLNVALKRSELCSVAVNVMTRLLGCEVVRQERFQNADGRCTFHIFPDRPTRLRHFELEPAPE